MFVRDKLSMRRKGEGREREVEKILTQVFIIIIMKINNHFHDLLGGF